MQSRNRFRLARGACYIGYVAEAVCINFCPLLFLTFEHTFSIGLWRISLLIGINFAFQLATDLCSALFLPHVNVRAAVVCAQLFAALGLFGIAVFPAVFPTPFGGLCAAVVCCGIGGGLSEVLISPLCEACVGAAAPAEMSWLHSFYCWGQAGVILTAALFFALCGVGHWRVLACLLAALPLGCALLFCVAPLPAKTAEQRGFPLRRLLRRGALWRLLLMMTAAGAAEMIMGQWASSFAESGLGATKAAGDLLGPCLFALLMGAARVLHARRLRRVPLPLLLSVCALLCTASYLLAALATVPWLALAGCGLCGLSVGIFWPGIYGAAGGALPGGGVALYALLALAGDVGCLAGPSLAGAVAAANGGDLRAAFLVAAPIPLLLLIGAVHGVKQKRVTRRAGDDPSKEERIK